MSQVFAVHIGYRRETSPAMVGPLCITTDRAHVLTHPLNARIRLLEAESARTPPSTGQVANERASTHREKLRTDTVLFVSAGSTFMA
jgi:hypothetical protein